MIVSLLQSYQYYYFKYFLFLFFSQATLYHYITYYIIFIMLPILISFYFFILLFINLILEIGMIILRKASLPSSFPFITSPGRSILPLCSRDKFLHRLFHKSLRIN